METAAPNSSIFLAPARTSSTEFLTSVAFPASSLGRSALGVKTFGFSGSAGESPKVVLNPVRLSTVAPRPRKRVLPSLPWICNSTRCVLSRFSIVTPVIVPLRRASSFFHSDKTRTCGGMLLL